MKSPRLFVATLLLVPFVAIGQTEQDDAKLDESIRNFGFTSGAAIQCASDNDKPALESKALGAFTGIVRLFGSDNAFFYAAALGAGSTMQIDLQKCGEYTADFNKLIDQGRRPK